jgi:peroxiredoxin
MRQWALSIDIDKVQMLPDGNGTFARRMGALVGKDNLGFGARSWRYALLARDRQIAAVFAEEGLQDDAVEDPFERSDADAMLAYLRGETPGGVVSATRAFSG